MTRRLIFEDWHGVFNPKGELEAVEGTKSTAELAAMHLSPAVNRVNRTVETVTVIRGEIGGVLVGLLQAATAHEAGKRIAAFVKAKGANLSPNEVETLRRIAQTAVDLQHAIGGEGN